MDVRYRFRKGEAMKKCKCGETRQSRFYGQEKSRCLNCRSAYNAERYQKNKKRDMAERLARIKKSLNCAEAAGAKFSSKGAFKRFCAARRESRGSGRMEFFVWCSDCGLQDRVDSGFIPEDIRIMKTSLMAQMN